MISSGCVQCILYIITIESNFSLWGLNSLSADFRMFIFNFLQGRLYLNNVLARMEGSSPNCTFCEIRGRAELAERGIGMDRPEYLYYLERLPSETVEHLFWGCESSNDVIQKCYRWVRGMDWYNGNETIGRVSFMMGVDNTQKRMVITDLIWKFFVKYFIYGCRNRRKIPHFPALKFELEGLLNNPGMHRWKILMTMINGIY